MRSYDGPAIRSDWLFLLYLLFIQIGFALAQEAQTDNLQHVRHVSSNSHTDRCRPPFPDMVGP